MRKRRTTHRFLRKFYPDQYLGGMREVDFPGLYAEGYRGVIFDIDNTLVPHGAPATPEVIAFFARLHGMGFATCLLSNNQVPRVKPFADAVNSHFIARANKPSVKNYERACTLMGTGKAETIFIGDQLFTDVWGAKRCGMRNILLAPIHPKEEIQIVLKRILERIVLAAYRKELSVSGIKKTVEK